MIYEKNNIALHNLNLLEASHKTCFEIARSFFHQQVTEEDKYEKRCLELKKFFEEYKSAIDLVIAEIPQKQNINEKSKIKR